MNRCAWVVQGGSKRGVALIIVLGFLSLLIILALGFLLLTRTERLVADSTLEAQRGRQMVRTALSAAMNDYSYELWAPDRYMLPPPGMEIYPSVPPTASVDIHETLGQSNIQLLSGEARLWLPSKDQTEDVARMAADAEWILVREDPAEANSRILGRYAYVCFDMSGGIDANLIALDSGVAEDGNPLDRTSVRGVGMGELTETANAEEFKRLRTGWHGFDNLVELKLLTNGKYNGGENSVAITYGGVSYNYNEEGSPAIEFITWSPPPNPRWQGDRVEKNVMALDSSEINDLVPYSLSAYRGLWDWGAGDWTYADILACDESDSWTSSEWNQALSDVSDQVLSMSDAVKALEDYVSGNPVPQGVDYPSSKAVPMFNELEMTFEMNFTPATAGPPPTLATLSLTVELEFETWYPFPSDDNSSPGTFQITAPPMAGGYAPQGVAGTFWLRCRLANGEQVNLTQLSVSPAQLDVPADFNGGDPERVAGTISYQLDITHPTDPIYVFLPTDVLQIRTIVAEAMITSGDPVDQMKFQKRASLNLAAVPSVPIPLSFEVDDPRLNHLNDNWSVSAAASWNTVNPAATSAGYEDPGGEGLYLYCRNESMQTPGEIGFISTGRPWQTIDLCTPEGATMLSKLVSSSDIVSALQTTNTFNTYYANGTINPNTSSSNVLVSAYIGLLKKEVPNQPNLPGGDDGPMAPDEASDLASSILTETLSKRIETAATGAFMNGSDWVRVPAMGAGGVLSAKGLNKNQREGLLRNTWGLFSPNKSLFTVLVIGQPIKEGPNQVGIWDPDQDMITGERRGVALVWRDPTPSGPQGHHEMFMRMFKFLDE